MLGRRRLLSRAAIVGLIAAILAVGDPAAASSENRAVPRPAAPSAEITAAAGVAPSGAASTGEPGSFVSLAPSRVLDTRSGNGAGGPVAAGATIAVQITGRGGVPSSGVAAVALNVTETGASQSGFITVYPDGTAQPTASNLNFPAGDTRANSVTVKLGSNGKISLTNSSSGRVHLIADVAGYYLDGTSAEPGSFVSLAPSRLLDTRTGNGASGIVAANGTIAVQVTGRGGVPSSGVSAVVLNVTATGASQHGFVTVYPDRTAQPTASNLNFPAGDTRANLVTVKLGGLGKVALTNTGDSRVHLIADVAGYYLDGWSTPEWIDPDFGMLQAVDCPTTSFCVAGDYFGGVVTFDGSNWSEPVSVDRRGSGITSISCADASFCVAVDWTGAALVFDGSTWSPPTQVLPPGETLDSVSCPTATFCAAVGSEGSVVTFNGETWSTPLHLDPNAITSVSCATATFCVAANGDGAVTTFDGAKWSALAGAITLPYGSFVRAVSCPTTTFCAAVTNQADVVSFDGTTWSSPVPTFPLGGSSLEAACAAYASCVGVDGSTFAIFEDVVWTGRYEVTSGPTVACATSTFCIRISRDGTATSFDGARWSAPTSIDPRRGGLDSVSCPTTSFCAGADSSGFVFTFDGQSWSTRIPVAADLEGLRGVSCASESFCVAAGGRGYVSTFSGEGWSSPLGIGSNPLTDISCPTSSFCMAVDDIGGAYTFDGSRWSSRLQIRPNEYPSVSAVSCVSESFCAAVFEYGYVTIFDGSKWSYPEFLVNAQPGFSILDISCASQTSCVVVDSYGEAFVLRGTTWSAAMPIGEEFTFNRVSCATAEFCVAVDGYGFATTFDGTSWSPPTIIAEDVWGAPGVDCLSEAFCGVVFSSGHATIGRPPS